MHVCLNVNVQYVCAHLAVHFSIYLNTGKD